MAIRGLMLLVQHLPLATEIEATKNIVENADKKWTLQDLTKILQKRAAEWLMLPSANEVAAVSVNRNPKRYHLPTCHNWLALVAKGFCTRKDCPYEHVLQNTKDVLISSHSAIQDKGNCTRHNCIFKHLPDATLPQAPAQEVAAAATQPNQHTSELDELKAMVRTLMKEGADQKALITAILASEEE